MAYTRVASVNPAPGGDTVKQAVLDLDTDLAGAFVGLNSLDTLKATLASPTFTGAVGGVTKAMVGLPLVDNTADAAKPISAAVQTVLTAILAGSLGYEAGNALKLGGVLATLFWNDNNCTKNIASNMGWERLKSGKLSQWFATTIATGGFIDFTLPTAHANASYITTATAYGSAILVGSQSLTTTQARIFAPNGTTVYATTVGI